MMRPSEVTFSRVDIRNFKSIRDARLRLRQLTVLVGENSAGKSSVLQTLSLLAQVARGRPRADVVSLNGMELSLGNFVDVLHSGAPGETIEIGLTVPTVGSLLRRRLLATRSRTPGRAAAYITQGEEDRAEASWKLTMAEPQDQLGVAAICRIEVHNSLDGVDLAVEPNLERDEVNVIYERSRRLGLIRSVTAARGPLTADGYSATRFKGHIQVHREGQLLDEVDEDLPAVAVENGFPAELYEYVHESHALAQRWLEIATMRTRREASWLRGRSDRELRRLRRTREHPGPDPAQIAETLFPSFRRWVDEFDRSSDLAGQPEMERIDESLFEAMAGVEDDVALALSDLLETSREEGGALGPLSSSTIEVSSAIRSLLYDSVHYLGPLREAPSPSYRPGQSGGVATLGIKGEFTVAALDMYGAQVAEYPLPDGITREVALGEAVNEWARRFDVAREVRTHDKGRLGIELELIDTQTGQSRDFTNVGVGVSQLLPVIVICLLAQPGQVVLLEQPELHLHPAPQQVLGDFLIAVAESGRQLIVETHSEYLINRLRLRIAEDEFGSLNEELQIWYAKRQRGRTTFEPLEPNRYGTFEQWPEGFFDQAPREAELILRAAARKRRAQPALAAEEPEVGGLAIHVDYQHRRIEARFDPETESITVLSEPFTGQTFDSPSGAASAVIRHLNPAVSPNRNGWGFWIVSETGEMLQSVRRSG